MPRRLTRKKNKNKEIKVIGVQNNVIELWYFDY